MSEDCESLSVSGTVRRTICENASRLIVSALSRATTVAILLAITLKENATAEKASIAALHQSRSPTSFCGTTSLSMCVSAQGISKSIIVPTNLIKSPSVILPVYGRR